MLGSPGDTPKRDDTRIFMAFACLLIRNFDIVNMCEKLVSLNGKDLFLD